MIRVFWISHIGAIHLNGEVHTVVFHMYVCVDVNVSIVDIRFISFYLSIMPRLHLENQFINEIRNVSFHQPANLLPSMNWFCDCASSTNASQFQGSWMYCNLNGIHVKYMFNVCMIFHCIILIRKTIETFSHST